MRLRKTGLTLLVLAAIGQVQADQYSDTGFYLSAGAGRSWIQSGLPDESTAYLKAAGGWQLTPLFAVELGLHHFAEMPGPTPAYADFDLDGTSIAVIGQLPLSSELAVFAKAGSMWWSAESSFFFFNRSGGPNQTGTLDFNESDLFLGLGLSYEIMEPLELNLEYNRYDFDFPSVPIHSSFDNDNSAFVLSLKWEL